MSPPHASTRREFLTGKAASTALADAARAAAGRAEDDHCGEPPPTARYLIQVSRIAMACTFEIWFSAEQYPEGTECATAALDLVDRLEDQMSVYRDCSRLSKINRDAGSHAVVVEPRLFDLLRQALKIFAETTGAFDITAGPLSRAWGFRDGQRHDRSDPGKGPAVGSRSSTPHTPRRVPSDMELSSALARVGSQHVQLNEATRSVRFLTPGIEINLGGIGKGYALDRCAELLREAGMNDFLIHGGQSSVLAVGSHPATPGRGWNVGLRHPLRPDRRLAEFFLRDRALGTSGSGTQFFHHRGKRYGHLIDPRTGRPAEGVYSATVLAAAAAEADALATGFYVLGPDSAHRYCATHPQIGMLLAAPGSREGTLQLHPHGLETCDWQPVATHGPA